MIVFATDASGIGLGGWAYVKPDGKIRYGTPDRQGWSIDDLELIAMYEAIRSTPRGSTVHLRVDSQIALARIAHRVPTTGVTFKTPRRLRGGIADQVIQVAGTRDVIAHWVRGHSTDPMNRAADRAAACAARNQEHGRSQVLNSIRRELSIGLLQADQMSAADSCGCGLDSSLAERLAV